MARRINTECKVEWCDRPERAAGWCNAHYQRQRLGKDMDTPHPPPFRWGQQATVNPGDRFGRLTVIRFERMSGRAKAYQLQCDCGKTSVTTASKLLGGRTLSCGCISREKLLARCLRHGHARHGNGGGSRVYHVWNSMKGRCLNVNDKSYSDYGGRGVEVCERWRTFENFLADMGEPPEGMTIERTNNNGNYEPDNCKWATVTEQNRNKRTNAYIEYQGMRRTISHVAEDFGVSRSAVRHYVQVGLPVEDLMRRCADLRERRNRGERGRGKAF